MLFRSWHATQNQYFQTASTMARFDIQPLDRFQGSSAAIRRPKVDPCQPRSYRRSLTDNHRKSLAFLMMMSIGSIAMTAPSRITTLHSSAPIYQKAFLDSGNWTIRQTIIWTACSKRWSPWNRGRGRRARRVKEHPAHLHARLLLSPSLITSIGRHHNMAWHDDKSVASLGYRLSFTELSSDNDHTGR